MAGSPHQDSKQQAAAIQLYPRLQSCWEHDIEWTLIPKELKECIAQVAKAISMPPTSVLSGLVFIISYSMSHSVVRVAGTDWMEPVLVWMGICMPTGCGKSSLYKYLRHLVEQAHDQCGQGEKNASWLLDDQSFEKLGELMEANYGKGLGLCDELPMFLSQLNICRGRTLSESQQVAIFLQLFGGNRWVRKTVSGESNFSMDHTGLTVGGFTQPSVARGLIEYPPNVEKGLCQRFLWLLPKPKPTFFANLEKVDESFSVSIVALMAAQWKPNETVKEWILQRPCDIYAKKYDSITNAISKLASMDDLLAGMLSKSKGQILRVAATMHVLFHWAKPQDIPSEISDNAIAAAINFVDVCIQHTAFLAGRGEVNEAIASVEKMLTAQTSGSGKSPDGYASAAVSLTLPGSVLNMSALLSMKKLKYVGNKAGGVRGWELLEGAGLGTIIESRAARGTDKLYDFHKQPIPQDSQEKEEMITRLLKFKVSLTQYKNAFEMENVTMETIRAARAGSPTSRKSPRRSPRKSKSRKKLKFEEDEEEETDEL